MKGRWDMKALKMAIIICITLITLSGCTASADTYKNVMELSKKYDGESNVSGFFYNEGYRVIKKTELGFDLKSYDFTHGKLNSINLSNDPSLVVFGTKHGDGTAILRMSMSDSSISDSYIDLYDISGRLEESIQLGSLGKSMEESFVGGFDYLYDDTYLLSRLDKITIINTNTGSEFDLPTRDYLYTYIGDGILAMTQEDEDLGTTNIILVDIAGQKVISDYKYEGSKLIYLEYDAGSSQLMGLTRKEVVKFDINNQSISGDSLLREITIPHMKGMILDLIIHDGKLLLMTDDRDMNLYEEINKKIESDGTEVVELASSNGYFYYDYVEKFNEQTDGPKIEINDFDGDILRYQNQIGTRMMSGDGPELFTPYTIDLSGLYKKGFITDMDSILKEDSRFDMNGYEGSIIRACSNDGKLLAMPFSYSVGYWLYDMRGMSDEFAEAIVNEDLDIYTLKDYLIKENSIGNDSKISMPSEEFAIDMIHSTYPKLWNKDGSFTVGAKKLLNEALKLSMEYKNAGLFTDQVEATIVKNRVGSYYNLYNIKHDYNNQFSIKLPLTLSDGEQNDRLFGNYLSINKDVTDSQKKAICDFFSFMLSDNEQEDLFKNGLHFPIRTDIREKYREKISEEEGSSYLLNGDWITETAVDEKSIAEVEAIVKNLNANITRDSKIDSLISTEVIRYMRDEITIDEAVNNITSKYETYRSEQN